jgi:hypothetical protein
MPHFTASQLFRRFLTAFSVLILAGTGVAQPIPSTHIDNFSGRPRVIVISDIGNEPDDQMSLVRFLLYSNEFDVEALIAATSTWQKTITHPETMHTLIRAYGEVRPNLLRNAPGWPAAEDLDRRVFSGQPAYGLAATGADKSSPGSQAIVRAIERDDPRPLWITIWGGANTLAQALIDLRSTHSPAEVGKLIGRLRVYSISDQDDAGPWIRHEFPGLFYIVQPSEPNAAAYYYAAWTGISGDIFYRNCAGADPTTVTNEWLDDHIRKGPLGKDYPRFAFIMEGDTPSFLNLIDNGLDGFRRPDWGGWGGRYLYRQPYGETHPIWTQGGDLFTRVTSQDTVTGVDGRQYVSDQATIWRWRTAFQHDFAARMAWTIADPRQANHTPVVSVNGQAGTAPIYMDATVDQPVTLDASQSRDPDSGQTLHFLWFHYPEAGAADGNLSAVTLAGTDTSKVTVIPTAVCRPMWLPNLVPCKGTGTAHIILAVTDDGSPTLTSYRRIILTVHPAAESGSAEKH